jgi:hypothetical protein
MVVKKVAVIRVPSPAEIQRALEAKYKVIPSPWWVDLAGQDVRIDGVFVPVGKELIFKCANSGVICGAGVFCSLGLMRFSAAYGNDPYETRRSGKITGLQTGEAIKICDASGNVYDYHPTIVFYGGWARYFLTELWSTKK